MTYVDPMKPRCGAACRFEGRYDGAGDTKVYLRDICVACGLTVERGPQTISPDDWAALHRAIDAEGEEDEEIMMRAYMVDVMDDWLDGQKE